MAKRRSGEREAWWRKQVRKQAASGLSVRLFCEQGGLSEALFYAWRRTLRARETEAKAPEFVPLMLATPVANNRTGITVELRGGRVVRLPETMATEHVVALLRGLEADEVTP